jgi:hypothetical protein
MAAPGASCPDRLNIGRTFAHNLSPKAKTRNEAQGCLGFHRRIIERVLDFRLWLLKTAKRQNAWSFGIRGRIQSSWCIEQACAQINR